MLEISSVVDNRHRRVDVHNVRVGNKLAHKMSREELHRVVKELGVPRIKPEMGMQETIFFLGVHQLEQLDQADAAT